MQTINDFKKIESFLGEKLVNAKLDSFCVFSLELQLNFFADSPNSLQSYWLCMTGNVKISNDENTYEDRSQVVANLYALIGQKITAVKIEDQSTLIIYCRDKKLTVGMDSENLEVVWSLTPESPDSSVDHSWSVILTDESELIMSARDFQL